MAIRSTKSHHAVCDCEVIHPAAVKRSAAALPPAESLLDLAEFFRIFGDSTRVGILSALRTEELCVCDICAVLNMTQSAISHQLRILKQARLVRNRRDGKVVYYRLDDEHIRDLLDMGVKHMAE